MVQLEQATDWRVRYAVSLLGDVTKTISVISSLEYDDDAYADYANELHLELGYLEDAISSWRQSVPTFDSKTEQWNLPAMADETVTKTVSEWGRESLDCQRRLRERIAKRIEEAGDGFFVKTKTMCHAYTSEQEWEADAEANDLSPAVAPGCGKFPCPQHDDGHWHSYGAATYAAIARDENFTYDPTGGRG